MQEHCDPLLRLRLQQTIQKGLEDPLGVMPAGDAVLVVTDADHPGILDGFHRPERHIRRGFGASRLVEQIVSNQAGRRNRARALLRHVKERPVDQVDRATPGDFRVGLNIRDEKLDRFQVGSHGVRQSRRHVRRKQAGVLGARRVDDEVGGADRRREARVQRQGWLSRLERQGRRLPGTAGLGVCRDHDVRCTCRSLQRGGEVAHMVYNHAVGQRGEEVT